MDLSLEPGDNGFTPISGFHPGDISSPSQDRKTWGWAGVISRLVAARKTAIVSSFLYPLSNHQPIPIVITTNTDEIDSINEGKLIRFPLYSDTFVRTNKLTLGQN